jgi:hypothetical protein
MLDLVHASMPKKGAQAQATAAHACAMRAACAAPTLQHLYILGGSRRTASLPVVPAVHPEDVPVVTRQSDDRDRLRSLFLGYALLQRT